MSDIHVNIKRRREELGMSQDELAHKVGYTSRSTIARIERGDIDIPQSKVELFARALKVLPEYLMGWTEEDGITITDADLSDPEIDALVEKMKRDDRFKRRMLRYAELLEEDL
jgi:transcriptional regulator with XRE-family HTH domain